MPTVPNSRPSRIAAAPQNVNRGRWVSHQRWSERLIVLKCEMSFWCFPIVGAVLCVFSQKTLVRKPFVDLDRARGRKLFG
jgi:hypothetical protein